MLTLFGLWVIIQIEINLDIAKVKESSGILISKNEGGACYYAQKNSKSLRLFNSLRTCRHYVDNGQRINSD